MRINLNKRTMITQFIFVLGSLIFTACNDNKQIEQSTQSEILESTLPRIEKDKNNLAFKDKNGKTITLNSLKGKVVFINFWATWCPPCIHEMPSINELKKTFENNKEIEFLLVDVDNKIEKSNAFMEKKKYDLPVYVPTGAIPSEYLGNSIPTTVILDKNGKLVARIEGGRDYSSPEIVKFLSDLIENK